MDASGAGEGVTSPPAFSFPARPEPTDQPSHRHRRTTSVGVGEPSHQRITSLERRSASTLPTFSFNSSDTSGRTDSTDTLTTSDTPTLATRSGLGHRRGASEYIGGSPRDGISSLISTSPVTGLDMPSAGLSAGSPMRKKGHAHRRSTAVSMHDVQSILQPRDANIGPPQTEPFNFPKPDQGEWMSDAAVDAAEIATETPAPQLQTGPRPRVGFSSNIEFIPRPLSTISSETESTVSAAGPASVSTSPLRTPQPPSPGKRRHASGRSNLFEVESASTSASSSPPPSGSAPTLEEVTVSEMAAIGEPASGSKVRARPSSGYRDFSFPPAKKPMNLDRRKSEPLLSLAAPPKARQSSISLREPLEAPESDTCAPPVSCEQPVITRKSSASRVKAWASSVVSRKDRKRSKQRLIPEADIAPETSTSTAAVTPSTEPDLEELFANDPFSQNDDEPAPTSVFTQDDVNNFKDFRPTYDNSAESGPVIDLDAAMESSKTPSKSPGFGARRQLHSSRMNRDLNGPVSLFHRRAESAPVLPSFDYPKSPSPQHSPMADVFEEEEEEEEGAGTKNKSSDLDTPTSPLAQPASYAEDSSERTGSRGSTDDGLGIHHPSALPPTPSGGPMYPHLRLTEDTIMEEFDAIEIVEAHEEPRASMITKSSDSSETPTLMAEPSLEPIFTNLAPPQAAFMAPSVYTESTVSTPDTNRRQGSFDTTRVGTSASSTTDCRTVSSLASDRHDTRVSVDDVPSLISSRSTTVTARHPVIRRGASGTSMTSSYSRAVPASVQEDPAEQRRRKRSSIASLTNLLSGPFAESKSKLGLDQANASTPDLLRSGRQSSRKKEHRLSKLMFWKHKGSSRPSTSSGI